MVRFATRLDGAVSDNWQGNQTAMYLYVTAAVVYHNLCLHLATTMQEFDDPPESISM